MDVVDSGLMTVKMEFSYVKLRWFEFNTHRDLTADYEGAGRGVTVLPHLLTPLH